MEIKGIEKFTGRQGAYSGGGDSDREKVVAKFRVDILRDREEFGKAVAANIFVRLIERVEMGELLDVEKLRDMAKEYGVFVSKGGDYNADKT